MPAANAFHGTLGPFPAPSVPDGTVATVTVTVQAPVITAQPASQAVLAGDAGVGKTLVAGFENGSLRVWDPVTEKRLADLAGKGHALTAWRLSADARTLAREYRFVDFFRTMSFVNALAHIANLEDHHPDLEVGYGYCRVRFTTHAIHGLSENDFICAAKIDQLPLA